MPRPPPKSTLFPYTTLFRSDRGSGLPSRDFRECLPAGCRLANNRSEEHTSNSSHSQISYAVFCLKKKNYGIDVDGRARTSTEALVMQQTWSLRRSGAATWRG